MSERASNLPEPAEPTEPTESGRAAPRRGWQPEHAPHTPGAGPRRIADDDATAYSNGLPGGRQPPRSDTPAESSVEPVAQHSADSPSTATDREWAPAAGDERRPVRPPVQQETAEVLAATRPGRTQVASERVWATAILLGAVGLLTGWITHDTAVTHLLARVGAAESEAQTRETAAFLHGLALGLTALGLVPESFLVAFLRGRRVAVRVLLSVFAVLSVVLLPVNLGVLAVPGWRGVVITITLGVHAVLAVVGSVLMWLPVGRPVSP